MGDGPHGEVGSRADEPLYRWRERYTNLAPAGERLAGRLRTCRNGPLEPAVVLQWGEGVPFPYVSSQNATAITCGDGVTAIAKDYPVEIMLERQASASTYNWWAPSKHTGEKGGDSSGESASRTCTPLESHGRLFAVRSRPVKGAPRVAPQAARAMAGTWRRDIGEAIWTEMCIGADWTRGIRLNHTVEMARTRRPSHDQVLRASTATDGTPPAPAVVPQAGAVEVDGLRHGLLRRRDLAEIAIQDSGERVFLHDSEIELPRAEYLVLTTGSVLRSEVPVLGGPGPVEQALNVERGIVCGDATGAAGSASGGASARVAASILVH